MIEGHPCPGDGGSVHAGSIMPSADTLIARLQADCTAAERAERADVEA
jgi:hypothetical protein